MPCRRGACLFYFGLGFVSVLYVFVDCWVGGGFVRSLLFFWGDRGYFVIFTAWNTANANLLEEECHSCS